MRHQMASSYDIEKINLCEAEIRHKLEILQQMMKDNQIFKQGNSNLIQEIQEINRNGEYEFERSQLASELREIKGQWRTTYYNKIDAQKVLINRHSAVVDLSKKCRKMYDLIAMYRNLTDEQRQELKLNNQDNIIEQEKLELMKEQVEEANQRRIREEKRYEESILAQAQKIQDKEYELKLMQLRVKEKEKELRL